MFESIRLYAFNSDVPFPCHATGESAGLDVWAIEPPKFVGRCFLRTGLFLLPEDHPSVVRAVWKSEPIWSGCHIEVRPRSSSFMMGYSVFPGTIDRDYREEIRIGLDIPTVEAQINVSKKPVAQLVMTSHYRFCAPKAVQRTGGFGSTDGQG
jgi:dUTPase